MIGGKCVPGNVIYVGARQDMTPGKPIRADPRVQAPRFESRPEWSLGLD